MQRCVAPSMTTAKENHQKTTFNFVRLLFWHHHHLVCLLTNAVQAQYYKALRSLVHFLLLLLRLGQHWIYCVVAICV